MPCNVKVNFSSYYFKKEIIYTFVKLIIYIYTLYLNFSDLLDHVYFTLMSKDEVENCLQSGLVKKSLNLVNKLNEAMDYFDKPTDQKIDYW